MLTFFSAYISLERPAITRRDCIVDQRLHPAHYGNGLIPLADSCLHCVEFLFHNLATLTVKRSTLLEENKRLLLRVRIVLMLVLVLGLLVALVPTRQSNWLKSSTTRIPACCFFPNIDSETDTDESLDGQISSFIISIFVLITGFTARIVRLVLPATELLQTWLREKASKSYDYCAG